MSWFAVRREVLEKLLESREWRERFERCETTKECRDVVEQFCKEQGLKAKRIKNSNLPSFC